MLNVEVGQAIEILRVDERVVRRAVEDDAPP